MCIRASGGASASGEKRFEYIRRVAARDNVHALGMNEMFLFHYESCFDALCPLLVRDSLVTLVRIPQQAREEANSVAIRFSAINSNLRSLVISCQ